MLDNYKLYEIFDKLEGTNLSKMTYLWFHTAISCFLKTVYPNIYFNLYRYLTDNKLTNFLFKLSQTPSFIG